MIESLKNIIEVIVGMFSIFAAIWWIFEVIGRIKTLEIEIDERTNEVLEIKNKMQEQNIDAINLFHEIDKVKDLRQIIYDNDKQIEELTILLNRFITKAQEEIKGNRIRINDIKKKIEKEITDN